MTTRSQQALSATIFNTHVSSSGLRTLIQQLNPKVLTDNYSQIVAVTITISIFDSCLTTHPLQENYITCHLPINQSRHENNPIARILGQIYERKAN